MRYLSEELLIVLVLLGGGKRLNLNTLKLQHGLSVSPSCNAALLAYFFLYPRSSKVKRIMADYSRSLVLLGHQRHGNDAGKDFYAA